MKRVAWSLIILLGLAGGASAQQLPDIDARSIYIGTAACRVRSGAGSPESSVVGKVCDVYINTSTGEIYRKLSGTGNTGWVGPSALTKTDDTNVTLTLGGSASTSLLNPASIALGWTGQLSVPRGGTGLGTLTTNGVLFGNGTSAIGVTSSGASNSVLAASGGNPFFTPTPTVTSITTTGTGAIGTNLTVGGTGSVTGDFSVGGNSDFTGYVGAPGYVSQTSKWRITGDGNADFNYLYTKELHAKAFIADLEQALAGGQIISKSVAVLGADFTTPGTGSGGTLTAVSRVVATGSATSTTIASPAQAHTAGNLITVGLKSRFTEATGCADTAGNTYFEAGDPQALGGDNLAIWYAYNVTGHASNVVTCTFGASSEWRFIVVREFSGAQTTADPFDDSSGNAAVDTSMTSGTVPVTTSNDVIFAIAMTYSEPVVVGSGYTGTAFAITGDAGLYYLDEYKVVSTSEAAIATQPSAAAYGLKAASFKAAPGASNTLTVEDLPSAPNMRVFQSGDFVRLRQFTRDDPADGRTPSLEIADAWGTVTSYSDLADGLQSWTFTRSVTCPGAMTAGTVIPAKSLALDYGVTGNGYYEVSAVDGYNSVNSPYAQIVTWATTPCTPTLRTRFGNLTGITSTSNEYGMIAGTYAATGGQFFRASNQAFELHGVDLLLWDGSSNTVKISRSAPSIALGSTLPTAYGTGTGIWMGKDSSVYKFRVGDPSGNRVAFDGTDVAITSGNFTVDASGVRLSSSPSSTSSATNSFRFTSGVSANFGLYGYDTASGGGLTHLALLADTSSRPTTIFARANTGFATASLTLTQAAHGTGYVDSVADMKAYTITLNAQTLAGTGTITMTGAATVSGTLAWGGGSTISSSSSVALTSTAAMLSANNTMTNGFPFLFTATTGASYIRIDNSGGNNYIGSDNSTATAFGFGGGNGYGVGLYGGTVGGVSLVAAAGGGEIYFVTGGGVGAQKMDTNGDLRPITDNAMRIGVPSFRYTLIRGVTITAGDVGFENGFAFTESYKVGIAEPGVALVNPDGEVVAFFGAQSMRGKGLAGPADVDALPHVITTPEDRAQMDAHPEQRVVGYEPVAIQNCTPDPAATSPAGRTCTTPGAPIYGTRPKKAMPDPKAGKTTTQRRAGGQ